MTTVEVDHDSCGNGRLARGSTSFFIHRCVVHSLKAGGFVHIVQRREVDELNEQFRTIDFHPRYNSNIWVVTLQEVRVTRLEDPCDFNSH